MSEMTNPVWWEVGLKSATVLPLPYQDLAVELALVVGEKEVRLRRHGVLLHPGESQSSPD